MPMMPAQCTNPKCRAIFPSGFNISNASNITMSGNTSRCPVCGSLGRVAEGVFDITGDTIKVLSAPDTTIDMLRTVQSILERTAAGEISKEEAEIEAAELPSALVRAIKHANENQGFYALITFLLTMAYMVWEQHGNEQFQASLLDALQNPSRYEQNEAGEGAAQAEPQQPPIASPSPLPSHRRAKVNAQRRADLKAHRAIFFGAAVLPRYRVTH